MKEFAINDNNSYLLQFGQEITGVAVGWSGSINNQTQSALVCINPKKRVFLEKVDTVHFRFYPFKFIFFSQYYSKIIIKNISYDPEDFNQYNFSYCRPFLFDFLP